MANQWGGGWESAAGQTTSGATASASDAPLTTEAGRSLLGRWMVDPKELWTVDEVTEALRAIEEEAGRAAIRDAIALIEQRDHDYALHEEDISEGDTWDDSHIDVYASTVAGVLNLLDAEGRRRDQRTIHAAMTAGLIEDAETDRAIVAEWDGRP